MKIRKISNRILAYTLTLAILLSTLVFGAVTTAAEDTEIAVWDGTTAETFAGGDGSASTPYLIENGAQLHLMITSYLGTDYEGKNFKITKDIYLNDVRDGTSVKNLADKYNWLEGVAAPTKANSFYGILDGDGHTIYGLYASGEEKSLGLIPAINNATVVKNLNFNNLYLRGAESSGGAIAGQAIYYNWQKTAAISNCFVTNAVIGEAGSGKFEFAAGLIGDAQSVKINFTNCYSYNNSFVDWTTGAGIVANDWDDGSTTYNSCYSIGYYPVSAAINKGTFNSVYTNTAAPEGTVATGIVTLEDAQMKGAAAKANMAGLDFAITWKTVENGYPVINNDIEFWDGTTATNYAGGTGTASDPWLIENGAQLLKMVTDSTADGKDAASVTNNYFKITADIYLNPVTAEDMVSPSVDSWAAKGYRIWDGGYRWKQNTGFCGNIDGDGHTIYGLYVEAGNYSGFLANVIGHASVNNLHFKNAFVRGATNGCSPAVIIGAVNGNSTVRSTATVTNCTVDNAYVFSDHTGSWRNGIIVGGGFNEGQITVSNCAVTNSRGAITNTSTEKRTAAFIGNTNYTKTHLIQNCFTDSSMHPVTDATTEANYDVIHDNKVYKNVYTSAAKPSYDTNGDITYLTEEQMKGENAKIYMPTLSFKYIWQTVDNGYPEINVRGEIWDGTNNLTDFSTFKGAGTHENPYIIENGNQLAYAVTKSGNELHYKLANDIVLNDTSIAGWEETANGWYQNSSYRFNGEMDGDGHTIEGLYWNAADTTKRYGLFAYCGKANNGTHVAVFKNITFTGASVNHSASTEGVAIVAGQASGETIFENIYIDETCSVNAPNVKGVAGLVGRGYNENTNAHITINNCAVLADITGKSHVGAFMGTFWDDALKVTSSNSFAVTDEGLIGANDGTATLTRVYATTVGGEDTGAVQVDAENMKGENAKTYMPGLDYDFLWKTVQNDYPVLRDMDERLDAWDGSAATTLKGEGTKANPYKISNGAELYYAIVTYSNADVSVAPTEQKYFEITSDINLANKQWYVPGLTNWLDNTVYDNIGFNGIIYGNGHTIYNFSSNAASTAAGLIPVATQGTEIYDLHLVGGTLPRYNWRSYALGGFIGLAKGTAGSTPITISGCSVKNFDIAGVHGAGGFIGYSFSQSYNIKDSYVVNSTFAVDADKIEKGTANASAFVGFVDGSEYNNSFVVENSYTDTQSATSRPIKDAFLPAITYKNVYTTFAAETATDGVTTLTSAQMTGTTAKTYMNGMNFNQKWTTVDGSTPVHTELEYRAKYFSGTPAESFAGGAGTEADPYMIENADQLYLLALLDRHETYGKFYKLANNISISNVYNGWANDDPYTWAVKKAYLDGFGYASSFAGTLDGAGYTVSGLYYNNAVVGDGTYAYGLMPFVTADAVIKNITVSDTNATVLGSAYVGAVAGAAHVMEEDYESSPAFAVQFIGVNVTNATINANTKGEVLGKASRGVKFELCNTPSANIVGEVDGAYLTKNCNNGSAYRKDVVVYNTNNITDTALENIRNVLLGKNKSAYVASLDMAADFNVCDLVAAELATNVDADKEKLVWSDEFNGGALDTSIWTQSSTSMSTRKTLEYANTATFDGDSMSLNCYYTGRTTELGTPIYQINYGLNTTNSMSYKYGRLEMHAKIPVGAGAFPALWLSSRGAMGYDTFSEYSTEIDVFEVFGETKHANLAETCIHKWYNDENGEKLIVDGKTQECSCGTGNGAGNAYKIETDDRSVEITYDWYTVEFEWTEDTMSFWLYKDGEARPEEPYYTATRSDMDNASAFDITGLRTVTGFDKDGFETSNEGIFNQYMSVIITNHMYTLGQTYENEAGETVNEAAHLYQGNQSDITENLGNLSFEIDYIRLYQNESGSINLK